MTFTLEELKENLKRHGDIVFLLDVLDLSMEELVEALSEHIEDNYDTIIDEYDCFGLGEDEDD
jgi:hypothetical protein